jgi:hypothetical protein
VCVYVRDTQPLSRERNISFQLRITSPFDYYTNVAARASAPLIKLRHRRRTLGPPRIFIYIQHRSISRHEFAHRKHEEREREKRQHAHRWTTFCVRLPENKRDIKGSDDKKKCRERITLIVNEITSQKPVFLANCAAGRACKLF